MLHILLALPLHIWLAQIAVVEIADLDSKIPIAYETPVHYSSSRISVKIRISFYCAVNSSIYLYSVHYCVDNMLASIIVVYLSQHKTKTTQIKQDFQLLLLSHMYFHIFVFYIVKCMFIIYIYSICINIICLIQMYTIIIANSIIV